MIFVILNGVCYYLIKELNDKTSDKIYINDGANDIKYDGKFGLFCFKNARFSPVLGKPARLKNSVHWPPDSQTSATRRLDAQANREPNLGILEHERKRKLEVSFSDPFFL